MPSGPGAIRLPRGVGNVVKSCREGWSCDHIGDNIDCCVIALGR